MRKIGLVTGMRMMLLFILLLADDEQFVFPENVCWHLQSEVSFTDSDDKTVDAGIALALASHKDCAEL